ncbi:hypothetical protein KP509_13G005200 [Ceratopteris richardii]|uniref:Uncharacterized protein n=1 Tax=Ceratopteris richardii TaxID=49495 RepID=A0A8T2TCY3_CERRI|nr:hypothetical protein KP509_13G005200 [Ceratopteris richardii]KAH7420383.1 hypothetical protein KP509_13G005200 [Ceratopteris richardii]
MTSIDSMPAIEDTFCKNAESTAVTVILTDIGHENTETVQIGTIQAAVAEAEKIECECCGLTEECTPPYISHVKGLYCGRWLCGLCQEAVKEEYRQKNLIKIDKYGLGDALSEHMSVCKQFNSPQRMGSPVADISAAVRKLFRHNLDNQLKCHSLPSSPARRAPLSRANSCFGAINPASEGSL